MTSAVTALPASDPSFAKWRGARAPFRCHIPMVNEFPAANDIFQQYENTQQRFIHSFFPKTLYLLGARSWDIQQCTNTAPSPGQPLGYREGTESPAWVRANLGVLNPRSLRDMTWALSKLQNLSWSHKTEIVIPASSDVGGSGEIMNSVPQHDVWKPPIGIQ